MISGLESDQIQEIIDVQALCSNGTIFLSELDDVFCDNQPQTSNNELSELSDTRGMTKDSSLIPPEIAQRIDAIEKSANAKSTKEQMQRYSKKFMSFLSSKGFSTDLKNIDANELSQILRYFYSDLKTDKGKLYAPATLVCIRAALHRFFNSPDLSLKVNIMEDKEFIGANQVLKGMIKQFMEQGGDKNQFEAIEENDLQKMRVYFDRSTPSKLQEIYFTIEYFWGTGGESGCDISERTP